MFGGWAENWPWIGPVSVLLLWVGGTVMFLVKNKAEDLEENLSSWPRAARRLRNWTANQWWARPLALVLVTAAGVMAGRLSMPAAPPSPTGLSPAQVDEKVADKTKQLKAQLDQSTKEAETLRQGIGQQVPDAVAKATAPLRAQIAQLQSDAPVSVDKLPTSLRLNFKGTDIEEIDVKNAVLTRLFGWRERSGVLTNSGYPAWTLIVVFKKPVAYKTICFEDHGSGIPTPESVTNPRYAIIQFDHYGPMYGLVDLHLANECGK